ncbi:MAG: CRISPR-associated endonuclease Cas1 [Myxococcota bacterium]|jgi:group II intron reverse transcriptase/maturase/CRISPR-associated endonuclease Cas1|nr:CRISPR-associated endonuclease Cas1 [Myxococcota bacterium]
MTHVIVIAPGLTAGRALLARLLAGGAPGLVLDYRGLIRSLLDRTALERLRTEGTEWLDLGELRRPVRLLEALPPGCPGAETWLTGLLRRFAGELHLPLEAQDIQWACHYASRLLGEAMRTGLGLGLLDLRLALATDSLHHQPGEQSTDPVARDAAREHLLPLLDRLLLFPELVALAGGLTPAALLRRSPAEGPRICWVELPRVHLARPAWQLLIQVLHLLAEQTGNSSPISDRLPGRLPLLLFPPVTERTLTTLPLLASSGPLALALTLPPTGRPPLALRAYVEGGAPLRLEIGGRLDVAARAAWVKLLGCRGELLAPLAVGEPVALTRGPEGLNRAGVRLLPGPEELAGDPLTQLRGEARRQRPAVPDGLLAPSLPRAPRVPPDPFSRLVAPGTLLLAWSALLASGGSPRDGVDAVGLKAFGEQLPDELATLRAELLDDRYRPLPPRWIELPKEDGGSRRIGLVATRDRVVQRAFLSLAEPWFEPYFSDRSFAFRAGRGAHQALLTLLGSPRAQRGWLVHLDVASCFDTVPHDLLLARFAERLPCPRMLGLLASWLRYGLGNAGLPDSLGVGLVQGWAIAPFLSNVLLGELDEELERRGHEFVRYADDLALLVDREVEAHDRVAELEELLRRRLQLRLNPRKTRIQDLASSGADYLGFRLGGPQLLAMAPDRFARALTRVGEQAGRLAELPPEPIERIDVGLERMVQQLEGLAGYYARLGLTPALAEQFGALSIAARAVIDTPGSVVAGRPGWARLPSPESLALRYGRVRVPSELRAAPASRSPGPYGLPTETSLLQWLSGGGADAGTAVMEAEPLPATGPVAAPETAAAEEERVPPFVLEGPTLRLVAGGVTVRCQGEELVLRRGRQELHRQPLAGLELILVQTYGVHLSSQDAWGIAGRDVAVIFACPTGDEIGLLGAPGGARAALRVAQARRLREPAVVAAGVAMLEAKLANQASTLRYLARAPGRRASLAGAELGRAADGIREIAGRLSLAGASPAPPEELAPRLMGHEGQAAALYWAALGRLVPEELGFPGRRTRRATDPVNQSLNYLYGILYGELWRALARTGLDPGMGILHRAPRSPGGLVYDLIEELRAPLADRLLVTLLGRGFRPATGLGPASTHLSLRSSGILSRAFASQRQRILRRGRGRVKADELPGLQAAALRSLLLGETDSYPAFHFRW